MTNGLSCAKLRNKATYFNNNCFKKDIDIKFYMKINIPLI